MPRIFNIVCIILVLTFGGNLNALSLTEAEKRFIAEHPEGITLGIGESFAPFVDRSDDGKLIGHDIDIASEIEKASGLKVRFFAGQWSEMVDAAIAGKFDGLSSVVSKTSEREEVFTATDSYISLTTLVLVKKGNHLDITGIDDLKGKSVVIQKGNEFFISVARLIGVDEEDIFYVSSMEDQIKMLAANEVDYTLLDDSSFYIANKLGLTGTIEGAFLVGKPYEVFFYLRNDYPEAVSIINKSLAVISPKTKEDIRGKWFGHIELRHSVHRSMVLKIVSGCLVLVLLFVVWIRKLSLQKRKIHELLRKQSLIYQELKDQNSRLESIQSELLEKNIQLERTNVTKNNFLSILGHDLRGPIGNISVILNDCVNEESPIEPELLKSLQDSSKSTFELLEDLLSWARSQNEKPKLRLIDIDTHQLFKETVAVFEAEALKKEIQLSVDPLSKPYSIHADFRMIYTVLRNLVGNALKFTPTGGSITLSSEIVYGKCRISVRDTGVGISSDRKEDIFSIDKKIRTTPGTENELGTGFGLVMCKEFVELNGGSIGVDSAEADGSCFHFTLQIEENGTSDRSIKASELNCLIIQDNYLDIHATQLGLNKMSISHQISKSSETALEAIRVNHFDLIIVDVDSKHLKGVDLSRQILELHPASNILGMSFLSKSELDERWSNLPFLEVIRKPLHANTLNAIIVAYGISK